MCTTGVSRWAEGGVKRTGYLFPSLCKGSVFRTQHWGCRRIDNIKSCSGRAAPTAKVRGEAVPADRSLALHLTNTTPRYRPRNSPCYLTSSLPAPATHVLAVSILPPQRSIYVRFPHVHRDRNKKCNHSSSLPALTACINIVPQKGDFWASCPLSSECSTQVHLCRSKLAVSVLSHRSSIQRRLHPSPPQLVRTGGISTVPQK